MKSNGPLILVAFCLCLLSFCLFDGSARAASSATDEIRAAAVPLSAIQVKAAKQGYFQKSSDGDMAEPSPNNPGKHFITITVESYPPGRDEPGKFPKPRSWPWQNAGTIVALCTLVVALYAGARSYYEFTANSQKIHIYNVINRLDNDNTRKHFTHLIAEISHPQNFKRPFSDFFNPNALRPDVDGMIRVINAPFRSVHVLYPDSMRFMWKPFYRLWALSRSFLVWIRYIFLHWILRGLVRALQLILTLIGMAVSLLCTALAFVFSLHERDRNFAEKYFLPAAAVLLAYGIFSMPEYSGKFLFTFFAVAMVAGLIKTGRFSADKTTSRLLGSSMTLVGFIWLWGFIFFIAYNSHLFTVTKKSGQLPDDFYSITALVAAFILGMATWYLRRRKHSKQPGNPTTAKKIEIILVMGSVALFISCHLLTHYNFNMTDNPDLSLLDDRVFWGIFSIIAASWPLVAKAAQPPAGRCFLICFTCLVIIGLIWIFVFAFCYPHAGDSFSKGLFLTVICVSLAGSVIMSIPESRRNYQHLVYYADNLNTAYMIKRKATVVGDIINARQLEFIDIVSKMLVSHTNWAETDFREIHLPQAKLDNVNLSKANFSGADLRNTSFFQACLRNTELFQSNLDMCLCYWADFGSAYVQEASLQSTMLYGANLSGINLNDAEMADSNMTGANLSFGYLNGAVLWRARLRYATLFGADLSETKAENSNFRDSDLSSASLNKANLSRADFTNANIQSADLRGSDLTESDLSDANLSGAKIDGATTMNGAVLRGAKLDKDKLDQFPGNLSWDIRQHIFSYYNTKNSESAFSHDDKNQKYKDSATIIYKWGFLLDI